MNTKASKKQKSYGLSTAFFGILLVISLILNIALLERQEKEHGIDVFSQKHVHDTKEKRENKKGILGSAGKIVKKEVDGKIWIQLPDPIFEATFITDKTCSVCVDFSDVEEAFEQQYPTATLKNIDISSAEANFFRDAGGAVVPAIVLEKIFEEHSAFPQLLKEGVVTVLGTSAESEENMYYEFRTAGNKKILTESQLPKMISSSDKPTVVAFMDFFSPDVPEFQKAIAELTNKYGENIAIRGNIFASDLPALFVAQALQCGVSEEEVMASSQEYSQKISDFLKEKQETGDQEGRNQDTEEADVDTIANILSGILQIEGDAQTCYEKREFLQVSKNVIQEIQELGIGGTPAYFIGNRFLAGKQEDPTVFSRALEEYIAEQKTVGGIKEKGSEEEMSEEKKEGNIENATEE